MNADDPKFTAHVLGELDDLTPVDRAEIEALLAADPAAAAEAAETRALAARLRAELSGEAAPALQEEQRAAVLRAVGTTEPAAKVVRFPRRLKVLTTIAAGVVVVVSAWWFFPEMAGRHDDAPNKSAHLWADAPESAKIAQTVTDLPDPAGEAAPAPVPARPIDVVVNNPTDERSRGLNGASNASTDKAAANGPLVAQAAAPAGGYPTPQPMLARSAERPSARPVNQLRDTESAAGALEDFPDNKFLAVSDHPLSTFGSDGATASYFVVRHFLNANQLPPKAAVRTEEMLNYFTYDYPAPAGEAPFSATMEVAACPWAPGHRLVRIGLRGRASADPAGAQDPKIQIEFNPAQVGSYRLIGYEHRTSARDDLKSDQKTPGEIEAGPALTALYELVPAAKESPQLAMLDRLKRQPEQEKDADEQVKLAPPAASVPQPFTAAAAPAAEKVGQDAPVHATPAPFANRKAISPQGGAQQPPLVVAPESQGSAAAAVLPAKPQLLDRDASVASAASVPTPTAGRAELLPSPAPIAEPQPAASSPETKRYFVEHPTAKAVAMKAGAVRGKDSAPVDGRLAAVSSMPVAIRDELLTLKLRYSAPNSHASKLLEFPLTDTGKSWEESSADFHFAAAVAGCGMLLRESDYRGQTTWDGVAKWAREGLGADSAGDRADFLGFVEKAALLSR
jgi:hypothetical protein